MHAMRDFAAHESAVGRLSNASGDNEMANLIAGKHRSREAGPSPTRRGLNPIALRVFRSRSAVHSIDSTSARACSIRRSNISSAV
jgi:hypothetical protein